MKNRFILATVAIFFVVSCLTAQSRYWVGGSGLWHDAAHWSTTPGGAGGASVPDSLTDVFFNAQSFSADGQYVANLSTDLEMYCKNITFANIDDSIDINFTSGLPGGIYTQAELRVYGNLTLNGMMSFDLDDGRVVLKGGLNRQVRFNGAEVGYFDISVDEETNVLVMDEILIDKGSSIINGNVFLNGDYKCGFIFVRAIDTSSVDIHLGTKKIQCGWWNSVTYNAIPDVVHLHSSGGYIECIRISPGKYIDYPKVVLNAALSIGSGNYTPGIDSNSSPSWTNDNTEVTFTSIEISNSGNYQILGSPEILDSITVVSGVDLKMGVNDTLICPKWHYIPSGCGGGSFTIRCATNGSQAVLYNSGADSIFIYNAAVKDMKGMGAPIKILNGINNGNNTNILFGAGALSQVYYWVGNGGLWNDLNHWSLSSGGPMAGCLPGPNDVVMFDNASFTLTGQILEIPLGIYSIKDMVWTEPADTVLIRFLGSFSNSAVLKIYGSVTLASKLKVSKTGQMEWHLASSGNIILDTKNVDLLKLTVESNGTVTLQSPLRVYDAFDINGGLIAHKQGVLVSNTHNIRCRSFFISTGGDKTLQLGNNDTLNTFSFRAVDDFVFPNSNHTIIARDMTHDYVTGSNVTINRLILLENSITNVSSLSLRRRVTFNYLIIDHPGVIRMEGDFTINNELRFLHNSGGIMFDDFPIAPSGEDTIIFNGNIFYPSTICVNSYVFYSRYIGDDVFFTKPSGTLTVKNTLLRNIITLSTGAVYTGENCSLAGTSQGWTITLPVAPKTYFWRGGNGDWDDPSHWSLTSGGVPNPGGCLPGIKDRVVFDNNSNTAFNPCNIYFPTYLQPVVGDVFILTTNKNINLLNTLGSLVMVTDSLWITSMCSASIDFDMTGLDNAMLINSDVNQPSLIDVNISKHNATVSTDRNLNLESLQIEAGNFSSNNFDLNITYFSLSPLTNSASVDFGTSRVSTTNSYFGNLNAIVAPTPFKLSVKAYFSTAVSRTFHWVQIENPAAFTFTALPVSYGFGTLKLMSAFDVTLADGEVTVTDSLILGVPGAKLNVNPSATLHLQGQLYAAGTAGNQCYLRSAVSGSRFDFTYDQNLCVSYLNAKDVEGLGPGIFNITNGTDGGNNTGIDFSTPTDIGKLYWRRGSGMWNVPSNWSFRSGSCPANRVPAATDEVYFDDNSDLDSYTAVTLPANAVCKNLYFFNFQDTVALDIGNTLSVTSCEIQQAKAVFTNGTFIDKTHMVVNSGSLGLISVTAGVNQYPSQADSIGFKIGAGSILQMYNSNLLVMGNKNVFGFPALYLDVAATITTGNADFTIYQPFAGEPVNEIFLFFGNRTINGSFIMAPTIAPAQKVRFMNSVTFNQSSSAAVGELILASGANVRFE